MKMMTGAVMGAAVGGIQHRYSLGVLLAVLLVLLIVNIIVSHPMVVIAGETLILEIKTVQV
jgi:hypothetical protein